MLKIKDIKDKEVKDLILPPSPSVRGVVLEVSDIEKAENSQYKDKFYAIIADETAAISVTIYDVQKQNKFIKGMAVVLMNILTKQNFIAVTSKTDVGICRPFTIPDDIRLHAPTLAGQTMTLKNALASPVKTLLTVKGKVVKLSPASKKRVEQNEVDFQEVMLKDTDSHATVAVWDKMVNTLQKGECVTITKCRVRLFNEQKRLTTTRSSQCEKLAYDETLLLVSDDEDDDVDNNGNWSNTPISDFKSGTITAVFDVDPYLACPTTSCNNTKLAPAESIQCMKCKNCGRNYGESACNNYIRATVMIEVEDSNKPPQKVAIFKPQIEKLFTSRGFTLPSSNDQTELLLKFFEIIPVDIKFHMINNTIKQLTCKRVA